jgi:hypothetical protein
VSVAVSLEELAQRVDDFGPVAFLVTTDARAPHVVSVAHGFDGERFVIAAGRSSRRNVEATGIATVLWPTPDDGPYCLIVDGDAATEGERIVVRPTRAVLHRLADASTDLPSCVPLEAEG